MAKQTFTTGDVLTATAMNNLQANDYNWTVSQKAASYVLVAADKGTRIEMNAAGATTITVNTGLFSAGDTLFIQNIGAGATTVTAGTATVNKSTAGSLTLSQYQGGTLYFVSASSAIFFADAGYTPPLTTKGDLFGYDTAAARIPIGSNNQVLTADSTQALGLKWATPSSGGMTLIQTGTFGASTLQFATIPTTYKHLLLVFRECGNNTNTTDYTYVRFNGDSTAKYNGYYAGTASSTANATGNVTAIPQLSQICSFLTGGSASPYRMAGSMWIYDYASSSTFKTFEYNVPGFQSGTGSQIYEGYGMYESNTAITQIDFIRSGSQTNSGTVLLYGVS